MDEPRQPVMGAWSSGQECTGPVTHDDLKKQHPHHSSTLDRLAKFFHAAVISNWIKVHGQAFLSTVATIFMASEHDCMSTAAKVVDEGEKLAEEIPVTKIVETVEAGEKVAEAVEAVEKVV